MCKTSEAPCVSLEWHDDDDDDDYDDDDDDDDDDESMMVMMMMVLVMIPKHYNYLDQLLVNLKYFWQLKKRRTVRCLYLFKI